ncbi:MAG: hypothetical protein FJ405_18255 [Verrucomicrobia bacterium]|nr:hypothetical protein [Verrucomicrobiota bacterium]
MKPNTPKDKSVSPPTPNAMSQDATQELQQTLTFETVEGMLSYDRSETPIPEALTRKLKESLPDQPLKPLVQEASKSDRQNNK